MNIHKNDQVLVTGGKDRGKKGKVLGALPKRGLVVVEGVNVVKRHVRPTATMRQAGIVERPAPFPASRVLLICDKCGKPTRVGHQVLQIQEGGKTKRETARICKQCKQQIGT